MFRGGRPLVKKIILLIVVMLIYIILGSSIVDYRSETKMRQVMVASVMEWSEREFGESKSIIEREKALSFLPNAELAERLKGKVLLQVESNGEAWYLNPDDLKRYFLGRPRDAWMIVQRFGLKMSGNELLDYIYFDKAFPETSAGRFLINDKNPNEAYYVHPESKLGIKLTSAEQAWRVIKDQGLGIENEKIREIEVGEIE